MSATAPARYTDEMRGQRAPDLNYFRQHYPATVTHFGTLPRREEWLRRVWQTDERWREALASANGRGAAEVVVRGGPPAGRQIEGEFEVIYAGGSLGLLHAAALGCAHGRSVLVFDEGELGEAGRGWNVSDEELKEFERAGLLTAEEIESAVVNRYGAGFVKFHDAASRVKAGPLWVSGVMDVAVDAEKLLRLAAGKLRGRAGCAALGGLRFVRAYVEPHRVTVETEDVRRGVRRLFAARLFVDAGRGDSAVARQLREGRGVTHVCPTVGTLARGYARGEGPDRVDFDSGELLVSTEDAADHRQLLWGGFPGARARGEYTACLFFHDAADSPADKSLLSLFERYFETLPSYKKPGAQWRVERPVFGYAPASRPRKWRGRARSADDRVMLAGDAAGQSSAWAAGGEGAHLRQLSRQAHLVHLALEADMLDAASLAEVSDCGPRAARLGALAEFMRPTPKGAPSAVNETLNALMAALHGLDERVRRQLLQDRMTPGALKSLLARTVKLYPRILARVREHLGARGTLCWVADFADEFWRERRGPSAAAAGDARAGEEERAADPAREFARRLALYKSERGGEG